FGEHPIGLASSHLEPGEVLLHDIIPGYVDNRAIAATTSVRPNFTLGFALTGTRGYTSIPLRKCRLEFAHGERLGDGHLVYRLFSVVLVCSHHEFTSRDHHHLGALGTVPKAVFRLQAASFNADLHLDPVASPWYCDGGRGPGRGGWCLGWHDDCYLL